MGGNLVMKKITSLFIMILLMSLVMFNGQKQVLADEPVEEGNVTVTTVLPNNVIIGSIPAEGSYLPTNEADDGYEFVYHVVNGKVYTEVPEGGFKFHTGMEIISVFTEEDKKVALFLDTNGGYLGVDYVTNTAPTAPERVTTNLSKPGFKVSETPFGPLEVIEEHTIFFVNYEKESTDELEIMLNDVLQTVQMNDV